MHRILLGCVAALFFALYGAYVPFRRKNSDDLWARALFYASLGSIVPASAVAGYFIGLFLDRRLHTGAVLSIAGIFAGTAAGIAEVIQLITKTEKNAAKRRDNSSD
ncbi:MAG TPA: AtpZ/AtpI family protein [Terriglobia bacterium]|nr:AtpZ/AtpI family protein [Terriglobia bacterium]